MANNVALGRAVAPCAVCVGETGLVCITCGGHLCPKCAASDLCKHEGPNWSARTRQLLTSAVDADDRAIVEAAAMLAAGYGVKFVVTIRNGLMVDVRAERLDYDHVGRVR